MGPQHIPGSNSFVQVACGDDFAVALNAQGQVYSWGTNKYGNLGLGYVPYKVSTPRHISSLNDAMALIACGASHSLVLTTDGRVYGWGANMYGQLGLGHFRDVAVPQGLDSVKVR